MVGARPTSTASRVRRRSNTRRSRRLAARESARGETAGPGCRRRYRDIPLKNVQIVSVFFMKLLLLPTTAVPTAPPPVPQSELPNQQWPPSAIEQPVTFTFGHEGQPVKLTQVVSPPRGATVAGAAVVSQA